MRIALWSEEGNFLKGVYEWINPVKPKVHRPTGGWEDTFWLLRLIQVFDLRESVHAGLYPMPRVTTD